MRKTAAFLIAMFFSFCVLFQSTPVLVHAAAEGDYQYTVNADSTATLTAYTGAGGAVTLPGTIGGHTVTAVGDGSAIFDQYNRITSLAMSDSVTSVGASAFFDATSLKTVKLSNNLTTIGRRAFYNSGLTSVVIPESVTDAGFSSGSFASCKSMTRIGTTTGNPRYSAIGAAMYSAGNKTLLFYCGGATEEFTVSYSVTRIAAGAFSGTSVSSVKLYENVTSIDAGAFSDADALASLSVASSSASFSSEDGVLFNKAKTGIVCYPKKKSGSSYAVPSTVTWIGDYGFYGAELTDITMSSGLKHIGANAFSESAVTKLALPDKVTDIGMQAFAHANALTEVTIPPSVTSINTPALLFSGSAALSTVNVVDGSYAETALASSCGGKLAYYTPKSAAADSAAALIDAIGGVAVSSGSAISAARGAYDALDAWEKALVANYGALTAAESAYDALIKPAVEVVDSINAIGTVTLSSKNAIDAARRGYNALSAEIKTVVTNYGVLTAAEQQYWTLKASVVKAMIEALAPVTTDSGDAIAAARAAYEALSADEKALVTNYYVLQADEDEIALLIDRASAEKVTNAITAIGSVTTESGPAIDGAFAAYNALSAKQKTYVLTFDKPTDMRNTYNKLSANAVVSKISAIGKVSRESKSVIESARAAYNALTGDQKRLVTNASVLKKAESELDALIKGKVVYIAGGAKNARWYEAKVSAKKASGYGSPVKSSTNAVSLKVDKSGKYYYIMVRSAYKMSGKTVYSAWSKPARMKSVARSEGILAFSWSKAPSYRGFSFVGFRVEYSRKGEKTKTISLSKRTPVFRGTGFTVGKKYYVRVAAVYKNNNTGKAIVLWSKKTGKQVM